MRFRRSYGVLVIAIICADIALAQSATQLVTIRRHSTVALTNDRADQILKDASDALQVDDDGAASDDIACNVTLKRTMDVRPFATTAPSSVSSKADFDAVSAEDSFAKIVDSITYCGGKSGSFAGCTTTPGRNMVLKVSGNNRGIVWAHEFGHATGLQHRPEPKALMTSVPLAPDQRYVNRSECDSYVNGPPVAAPANAVEQAKAESLGVSATAGISLQEMARASIVDRIPYSLISRAGNDDLSVVLSMLYDFREQDNWSTIVTIIGIAGGAESVGILSRYLDAPLTGSNPSAAYDGKVAALIALGYLANRFPQSDAVAALALRTKRAAWENAGPWAGEMNTVRQIRIGNLQEVAMTGLALSGHPEAAPLLANVDLNTTTSGSERNKQFNAELLATHERVRAKGLEAYYAE